LVGNITWPVRPRVIASHSWQHGDIEGTGACGEASCSKGADLASRVSPVALISVQVEALPGDCVAEAYFGDGFDGPAMVGARGCTGDAYGDPGPQR
jgi:hypothetical protein